MAAQEVIVESDIEILETKVLSDNWYTLQKYTFRKREKSGSISTLSREVYDRGNGAVVLLYNSATSSVVLTRQFRLPTFVNGNADGMLIEACAGLLDGEHPDEAIRREVEEETGFKVRNIEKIHEIYMSPGSVTELLYFYTAEYDSSMKVSSGGGVGDGEVIEVLEVTFDEAWSMVADGRIRDGKTIILLQHAYITKLCRRT